MHSNVCMALSCTPWYKLVLSRNEARVITPCKQSRKCRDAGIVPCFIFRLSPSRGRAIIYCFPITEMQQSGPLSFCPNSSSTRKLDFCTPKVKLLHSKALRKWSCSRPFLYEKVQCAGSISCFIYCSGSKSGSRNPFANSLHCGEKSHHLWFWHWVARSSRQPLLYHVLQAHKVSGAQQKGYLGWRGGCFASLGEMEILEPERGLFFPPSLPPSQM